MKGIVDIMKNKKRFFYHRLLFYILGLLIMSVGSNLFLKAALGVAPSCTMALTLSYLSPIHSYALFNFLINSTFLVCEALILHEFGKMQLTQLGLTFVYSLFIEFTSYGLFFIEPHGLAAKILLSVKMCIRDRHSTEQHRQLAKKRVLSEKVLFQVSSYNPQYSP